MRVSKPDKRIFLFALEKSGSRPEETLFIDDSTKNIDAAKALGIQAIQFDAYEKFLEEFQGKLKLD